MSKINARLNTAEHIFFRVLLNEYKAKPRGLYVKDNAITISVDCTKDLRKMPFEEFEDKVNKIIRKNLEVKKYEVERKEAEKIVDLSLVPKSVQNIRIIEIGNFDKQACATPHVDNTSEIGNFKIEKIRKSGKSSYSFTFTVTDKIEKEKMKTKKFKLQTARGVRDFPPEEKIIREKIINVIKQVFETYGYNPFETPVIERLDVLKAKFGAGEESDAYKEIFKFKDQGNRDLGLRFELTLGLCRFVGMNQTLKMPFKRYEIGRVYRDGPIKLGRTREFWQCDADVVGTSSMLADAEVLAIVNDVFKKLNLEIEIEVSSRKLLNGILEEAGIKPESRMPAMISIDKLKKTGIKGVNQELTEKGISKQSIEKINKMLSIKGTNKSKLDQLKMLIKSQQGLEGLNELKELFDYLDILKVSFFFNPSLARGLSYYTGPVYEAFLKGSKITCSVVGGGRYDKYIGNFLGGKIQIPATGLSFGLEPITEAIKLMQKELVKSVATVYVIPISTLKESLKIVTELRQNQINADIDLMGRGVSKNLDYANSLNIPYALIIGENELKQKKVKLKDMKTGKEELLAIAQVCKKLKND